MVEPRLFLFQFFPKKRELLKFLTKSALFHAIISEKYNTLVTSDKGSLNTEILSYLTKNVKMASKKILKTHFLDQSLEKVSTVPGPNSRTQIAEKFRYFPCFQKILK